jgi:hypothetical protein
LKTTIELPDLLFRKAKVAAAEDGKTLKDFLAQAVYQHLCRRGSENRQHKPWEPAFGGLRSLRGENRRIDRIISAEFGSIDKEGGR